MQRGEKIIAPFCPYQVAQVRARIVFSAFACRATLRLPWNLQITCCGQTWLTTSLPRPSRLRRETRPRKRTRSSFSHRSCQTRTWQSWEAAAVPSSLRGCSSKCGRSSGICCNYACGSSARSCDSFKKCYGRSCSAIVCTMPRRSRCTACSYERGRVLSANSGGRCVLREARVEVRPGGFLCEPRSADVRRFVRFGIRSRCPAASTDRTRAITHTIARCATRRVPSNSRSAGTSLDHFARSLACSDLPLAFRTLRRELVKVVFEKEKNLRRAPAKGSNEP